MLRSSVDFFKSVVNPMSKCPFKVNSKDTSICVVDLIQYIPIGK